MYEKILVTGGAGYIGSVLVPKLVERGYDVRVLDSMLFGSNALRNVEYKCDIIKGDIRDYELVRDSLREVDGVIHLAAMSNDPSANLDPKLTEQVNFEATSYLVEEAKRQGVQRFIHASSSSVYGIKEEPNVTEDLTLEPLTIYSKTKMWSEEIIAEAGNNDFMTVNIRAATVCGYSPRQRLDVIVNILASDAINRGQITVNGGTQIRANVHIGDITDLYRDLLSVPRESISGDVFNFGGSNYTVNEIADRVRNVIGDHVEINVKPKTSDSRSYSISSKKIKQTLGFSPKKTIEDAVKDLKEAFDKGLIPNPSNSCYRNIETMRQRLGIE